MSGWPPRPVSWVVRRLGSRATREGTGEPIFNKNCRLVGWLNQQTGYVFSTGMQFVAFTRGNALFSPRCNHIGFFMNGVFRDKRVGAVAFLHLKESEKKPEKKPEKGTA